MKVVVVGGAGALGKSLAKQLTLSVNGCKVINIDLFPNEDATENIIIKTPVNDPKSLHECLQAAKNYGPFEAIYCVAGGWQGGNAASKEFLPSIVHMYECNVLGAALAASLAPSLTQTGLLVFTSAKASLSPTPGMLAYGVAKAAINQLATSLASKDSGLPENSTVLTILPETLDTEANRRAMPNADFASWTPLELVSEKLVEWTTKKDHRPPSASLVTIVTRNNSTEFSLAG